MILAETWPSCLYLITWFVVLLLKITLKGLLADWKCLWSMFGIWFLNITHKSRNFHAFTQAYLAHAQTNFPAATHCENKSWKKLCPSFPNCKLSTILQHFFHKIPSRISFSPSLLVQVFFFYLELPCRNFFSKSPSPPLPSKIKWSTPKAG